MRRRDILKAALAAPAAALGVGAPAPPASAMAGIYYFLRAEAEFNSAGESSSACAWWNIA